MPQSHASTWVPSDTLLDLGKTCPGQLHTAYRSELDPGSIWRDNPNCRSRIWTDKYRGRHRRLPLRRLPTRLPL